ncbi:MAG: NDP-sugar synthase [Thermoplasmata archaeon]
MDAVILAAGGGTRLLPLTTYRPKPMIPIANRPLLKYILAGIRRMSEKYKVDRIYILVDHLANVIIQGIGDEFYGIPVIYIRDNIPHGTAGAVRRILDRLSDPFFCIHADIVTDFSFSDLIDFYYNKKGVAALTLTPVEDTRNFGVVSLDKDGRILSFIEKPQGKTDVKTVNAGIYVFTHEAFRFTNTDSQEDMARHQFPALLKNGVELYGLVSRSYWNDIGNPAAYLRTTYDVISGKVRNYFQLVNDSTREDIRLPAPNRNQMNGDKNNVSFIHNGNCIIFCGDSFIPTDITVNDFMLVGDCVDIKSKTVITSSVIWNNVKIGQGCVISDSIVGENVEIGDMTRIESGSVIGDRCIIGKRCVISHETKLWCGSRVTDDAKIMPD